MTKKRNLVLLSIIMCMVGTNVYAYNIAVKNADGVTICYNYIKNETELEVTYKTTGDYRGVVVIPEEVTYENRTRKVTSIGEKAFKDCRDLTSVTIGNNVISIGNSAFEYCSNLTSVTIPNSVTSIGRGAFMDCISLASIIIPIRVRSIDIFAFAKCVSLTSVTIPNSVTSLGLGAFVGCSGLTSVIIGNGLISIGNNVFEECHNLTTVTIGNSVTCIESCAFYNCSGLTSITIPNSVTSIESGAFYNCSGLTSITIPNSVTNIGEKAFYSCSNLTSVTIGNGVMSIGHQAFDNCDIEEIISKIVNPFAINGWTFSENTFYNATLYVPIGTISKYRATEGWWYFVFIEEGSPANIGGIDCEDVKEIKRFTLEGRVINNTCKGFNIIKMNNGTTKKMIVK